MNKFPFESTPDKIRAFVEDVVKNRWRESVKAIAVKHFPNWDEAQAAAKWVETTTEFAQAGCELAQVQVKWIKRLTEESQSQ